MLYGIPGKGEISPAQRSGLLGQRRAAKAAAVYLKLTEEEIRRGWKAQELLMRLRGGA